MISTLQPISYCKPLIPQRRIVSDVFLSPRRLSPRVPSFVVKTMASIESATLEPSLIASSNSSIPEYLEIASFTEYAPEFPSSSSATVLNPNERADIVTLNNPLQRLERMGCGWFCVILEWDGVVVEDDARLEHKAWYALAEEERLPRPLAFTLKRAQGMKNEQVISEVFCWPRERVDLKHLSKRKEELYEAMQGGLYRLKSGSKEFVDLLKKYNILLAVVSSRPRVYLERAIEAVGMEGVFDVVIAAEDVHRGKPDPEMFLYAAERLEFLPERSIVVGNSNTTIEAARDALMKVVAVVGSHAAYELGAADLVVRRLSEVTIVDLKNLADLDSPEYRWPPEDGTDEDVPKKRKLAVAVDENPRPSSA